MKNAFFSNKSRTNALETLPQWRFFPNFAAENIVFPFASAGRLLQKRMPGWWNGRHEGLKIPWPLPAVRVRVPLRALPRYFASRNEEIFFSGGFFRQHGAKKYSIMCGET